jgi:Fe2+ transport system protein FeoA
MMKKKLSEVKVGQKVKILGITKGLEHQSTLIGMGILPGDILEVTSKALLGSPITIKHGENNFLAIRKYEASFIEVE